MSVHDEMASASDGIPMDTSESTRLSERNGNLNTTSDENLQRKVKFTVTPVKETDIIDVELEVNGSAQTEPARSSKPLTFDIAESDENTDTLTQNSITALLSSKFRDIQKRLKQYGIDSPRFRKRLVSKWEGLNYDVCENLLYMKEKDKYRSKKWVTLRWLSKWVVMLGVGIGTALLAAFVHFVPVAAGSGIPLIKSYLNGIKVPGLLSLRAFIAKVGGVILSILGGLACGKASITPNSTLKKIALHALCYNMPQRIMKKHLLLINYIGNLFHTTKTEQPLMLVKDDSIKNRYCPLFKSLKKIFPSKKFVLPIWLHNNVLPGRNFSISFSIKTTVYIRCTKCFKENSLVPADLKKCEINVPSIDHKPFLSPTVNMHVLLTFISRIRFRCLFGYLQHSVIPESYLKFYLHVIRIMFSDSLDCREKKLEFKIVIFLISKVKILKMVTAVDFNLQKLSLLLFHITCNKKNIVHIWNRMIIWNKIVRLHGMAVIQGLVNVRIYLRQTDILIKNVIRKRNLFVMLKFKIKRSLIYKYFILKLKKNKSLEGPMAHSGGIIAAGFGKGRINFFGKKSFSFYDGFRDDHEIRDFVAGGAASGVSAAFGAPVGGTLFSLEEAASFWNQDLTWRVFFSSMVACFATNFLISAINGHPTKLSAPGLVRFNVFENDLSFDLIEIPVFILMAVVGGLIGALFVVLNYKLTVFRQKYFRSRWVKVIEAGLVAVVSAVIGFVLLYTIDECVDAHPYDEHAIVSKMFCKDDKYNSLSTLFLTTPEGCLKALLHDPFGAHGVVSLVVFTIVFFFLGVWTYGLSVSSGVFIPSLAIGAAWGRLVGIGVVHMLPDNTHLQMDVGKYALIGAACQLGGILRTTISLTVIIVECTGDISFGLPIHDWFI
ncbi:hypothetical protein KUTeg_019641 [Tegillarca granosa]|uniref:Chloride channel protein n=1 Tax=Tegillarca granosa TaxID=220873 RepID=A0ABQ9EDM2_TEGGR|nr:hypothetical protein KUTeg_019641 [Tegillarca granosa]